jgi:hypothetical protein
MLTAGAAWAEDSATAKFASYSGSSKKPSSSSSTAANTLKRVNAGTKKFVRGTIDVVTLKPLWEKKEPSPPPKPWLNNTHTKNTPKKKSFWGSLLTPEKTSQPQSMKDFVGMERPS